MGRIVSEAQGSSAVALGDHKARTAKVLRLGERSGGSPLQASDSVTPVQSEVPSPPRSGELFRAEKAAANYLTTCDSRRSVLARSDSAQAFDETLHAKQMHGGDAYSNVAIGRACDVDESTVRKWRTSKKPLPAWALKLLPFEVYRDLIADIEAKRLGKIDRRELPNVRPLLAKLDAQLASEDPSVALKELVAAARVLEAMIARLNGGGR